MKSPFPVIKRDTNSQPLTTCAEHASCRVRNLDAESISSPSASLFKKITSPKPQPCGLLQKPGHIVKVVKGYKLGVRRQVPSGELMHGAVIRVNNAVVNNSELLRNQILNVLPTKKK